MPVKVKKEIPTVQVSTKWSPPNWALKERYLFDILNKSAVEFVNRYTKEDGTLIWRDSWPGMDGSDDPYEAFMYLALLYSLGGSKDLYHLAHKIWDAITWQWTEYGQIDKEFDKYYDWMHHGEGYLYFYFLGLVDPELPKNKQRAVRFANFYTGDDPDVLNFDREHQLIRSPLTGSHGPRFEVTDEDWMTHRGILDDYLAPYEDLKGVDFESGKCPWSNDQVYKEIIEKMNERMNKGDVPLNLNATTLVTNAFMYTGDQKYREWVLNYLQAWVQRTKKNGGIIPDNIGLNGEIGEYNDGKWWGGYYGWRWPHGFMTIIEPIMNACMNSVLLTGNYDNLNLARLQLDEMWKLGKWNEEGKWVVPNKHFDKGWSDYRTVNPIYPIYLWIVSMTDEDLERINRIEIENYLNDIDIPGVSGSNPLTKKETKHYIANTIPWFHFIQGRNPEYPEQILNANIKLIHHQIEKMRSNNGNPQNWDFTEFNDVTLSSIHIWQEYCPVYFEGLLQMTLGAPMHISHGGLQHARLRYFDAIEEHPGLPEGVSALVEDLKDDSVTVTLINTNLFAERDVIIQAGGFCEHKFNEATLATQDGEEFSTIKVEGPWFRVQLGMGSGIKITFRMDRYVNSPTYSFPWNTTKTQLFRGRDK